MFTTNSNATQHSATHVLAINDSSSNNARQLYEQYRGLMFSLVNSTRQDVYYRVFENEDNSPNGYAIHEKLIHEGMSIADVSLGELDFPWFAADANHANEITREELVALADEELDLSIAIRLRAIANFSVVLSPFTRFYHYSGSAGTRAITIEDIISRIKFNVILTSDL